jgi:hypothetical protein
MENATRTQEIKDFIDVHQALFWYSPAPKSETVSDELLVESVLNYGTWKDVHEMFDLMGLQNASAIFRGMTGRKVGNYYPEIWNYFNLYFNKYAPRNS